MFVRFVHLKLQTGTTAAYQRFYEHEVAPALLASEGCFSAHLIQEDGEPNECVSVTFWRSAEDARAYEAGGEYARLIGISRPFLADSSESRMQLTEDLTLAYEPVKFEPEIEAFDIGVASKESAPSSPEMRHAYARVVSIRVNPDRLDDVTQYYAQTILPALIDVPGCRYACMAAGRDEQEVISLTLWNAQSDSAAYEASGLFDRLMTGLRPMLSSLLQWKMELASSRQSRTLTSDDVEVQGFRVLG